MSSELLDRTDAHKHPPSSTNVLLCDSPPTTSISSCMHVAALMSQVYEHQKDEDGFLYITYSGENTFG